MGASHERATSPYRGGKADHTHGIVPRHHECANRQLDCGASAPADRRPSLLLSLPEQLELRRIARRLGEAEVAEGVAGEQAPARGALNEAFLDQERLDDLLDGVAR